jgi:hypothetical protein
MKDDSKKRAVEMTGYGKRGKPKAGFPRFPQPLEIAVAIPHSHSPGDYREGKWKSNSRIPTFPSRLSIVLKNLKRRIPLNAGFPVVQAHRSIRVCWGSLV